jgi:hypothetical protein
VSKFSSALTRFSVSSNKLQIDTIAETIYTLQENGLCRHCASINKCAVEDEMYMLLSCPLYSKLHQIYGLEQKATHPERVYYFHQVTANHYFIFQPLFFMHLNCEKTLQYFISSVIVHMYVCGRVDTLLCM